MRSIINGFKKIQNVVNILTAIALVVMTVIVLVQTFTRYVIFYSLPWSEELSRYLFIFIIMLGFNVTVTKDLMVNINIIDGMVGKKGLRVLEIFRLLVGLFVEVFFFISSLQFVKIGWVQNSPAMGITMSYMYILVSVGFALGIISVVLKIAEKIMTYREEDAA